MKQYFKAHFLNPKSKYFVLTLAISFFFTAALFNCIEYVIPLNSFKLYEGEVENCHYETYRCKGNGKYSIAYCEMSVVQIKGYDRQFEIRDIQGRDAYLIGINKGDYVKIYVRYWYQYPLTFGSYNKIFHIEKGDTIYHSIKEEKIANISWIITSMFMCVLLLAFFIAGKEK